MRTLIEKQNEAIAIIHEFVAIHNRIPTYHENKITPSFPNGAFFRKSFGTLNNTIVAAGFNPKIATDPISGKKIGATKTFKCAQCNCTMILTGKSLNIREGEIRKQQARSGDVNVFCSHNCAATFNNLRRGPKSEETKNKISTSLKRLAAQKPPKPPKPPKLPKPRVYKPRPPRPTKPLDYSIKSKRKSRPYRPMLDPTTICGEYSKLELNKCKHCRERFVARSRNKYCPEHSYLYKQENRNRYAFTFSLSQYPDLFNNTAGLLKQHGMWSYSNTSGITRDHKISVCEAIRNNYDPFYIKHPLNCELMTWTENNKKKTQSSITYNHLKQLVDEYEINKLAPRVGNDPTYS